MKILEKIANSANPSGGGLVGFIKKHPKTTIGLGAASLGGAALGANAIVDNIGDVTHIGAIKDNSGAIVGGIAGLGAYKGISHVNNIVKREKEESDLSNPNNWR